MTSYELKEAVQNVLQNTWEQGGIRVKPEWKQIWNFCIFFHQNCYHFEMSTSTNFVLHNFSLEDVTLILYLKRTILILNLVLKENLNYQSKCIQGLDFILLLWSRKSTNRAVY